MKAYEFKITLRRKRGIWRKFVVPAGIKFEQLHDVIQVAMGWDNCHLYDFRFSNPSFIISTPGDFDIYGTRAKKADAETIDKYVEEQRKFLYVYDFGDNWKHRIELLKVIEDYPDAYPQVLSFKGNCPMEDSGGGYFDDPDECNEGLSELAEETVPYNLSEVNSYMQESLVLKKIKV